MICQIVFGLIAGVLLFLWARMVYRIFSLPTKIKKEYGEPETAFWLWVWDSSFFTPSVYPFYTAIYEDFMIMIMYADFCGFSQLYKKWRIDKNNCVRAECGRLFALCRIIIAVDNPHKEEYIYFHVRSKKKLAALDDFFSRL